MQMRAIAVMSAELANNTEMPKEMIKVCKRTAIAFDEMQKAYGKPHGYVSESNSKVLEHFESAYNHIELALTAKGNGFMSKALKSCFVGIAKRNLGYAIECVHKKLIRKRDEREVKQEC